MDNKIISRMLWMIFISLVINHQFVTGESTQVFAERLTSTSLPCQTDLTITTGLEWFKGANLILRYSVGTDSVVFNLDDTKYDYNSDDKSLTILNVEIDDEGEYVCSGIFVGSVSTVDLTVYAPPKAITTFISIANDVTEVEENSSRIVTCVTRDIYPRNRIQFSIVSGGTDVITLIDAADTEAPDGTFTEEVSVSVQFIRDYNSNQLECKAVYSGPGDNGIHDSDVTSQEELDVLVTYCDTLTISGGRGGENNDGDPVTIVCGAPCLPRRDIDLIRINNDGTETNIATANDAEQLSHVYTLGKQDNALRFQCDVEGRSPDNDIYFTVLFSASDMSATVDPAAYATLGSNIDIVCLSDEANPTASIEWSLDEVSPETSEVMDNACCNAKKRRSKITIPRVQRSNNGQQITCSIPGASITRAVILSVAFYPSDVTMTLETSGDIISGQEVSFRCVTENYYLSSDFTHMRWKIGNSHDDNTIAMEDDDDIMPIAADNGEKFVTSTFSFTAAPRHNGKYVTCGPRWSDGAQDNLKRSQQITVNFLALVSLSGCGNVDEGNDCALSCGTSDGYPMAFTYTWEFKRKFENNFETLEHTGQMFSISAINYMDAGEYKCSARNTGGLAFDSRTVNVIYTPMGVGTQDDVATYYSAVNNQVTLTLTVRSYPEPSFSWSKDRVNIGSASFESIGNDEYQSSFEISSVEARHYGNYTVVVRSDSSSSFEKTFTVQLEQRGKPEAPYEVDEASASSRAIVVSFMPGLDGGFPQMITAHYRRTGDEEYSQYETDFVNPEQGREYELRFDGPDFQSGRSYDIYLRADNEHAVGEASQSGIITVSMPGVVEIQQGTLEINENGETRQLQWMTPSGPHTALYISQRRNPSETCRMLMGQEASSMSNDQNCFLHNVTARTSDSFNSSLGQIFSLQVYQGYDLIDERRFTTDSQETRSSESSKSRTAGLISGLVVGVLIFIVAAVIVLIVWRRRRHVRKEKNDGKHPNQYMTPNFEHEIPQEGSEYADLAVANNLHYENALELNSLTPETLTLNQIHLDTLLYAGTYANTNKCYFKGTTCVIKQMKDDVLKRPDIAWMLGQIKALELTSISSHINVINLIGFNKETFFLVSPFATNGDLKTYLRSIHEPAEYTNVLSSQKCLRDIEIATQVIDGMIYLRQLSQVDVMHYQLSACHILVDADMTCKITNFSFAENVRNRQRLAMEQNDLAMIPWMAPECILAADEHTTKSDVWSFGVLLYEIAVNGQEPYPGKALKDVGPFVLNGNTMEFPPMSDHVNETIKKCWKYDVERRPSWLDLKKALVDKQTEYYDANAYEQIHFG